ncbi:MAG: 50S ribosomal protein L25 [Myxococcota bacterium]
MASQTKPTLDASVREGRGKGTARKLRANGKVPAVVYGNDVDSTALSLDLDEFEEVLETSSGHNTVFELALDDGTTYEHVIMRDYQVHPVKRSLLHVDLLVVAPDQEIEVKVAIEPIGRARGEREGGQLRFLHPEVKVRCTPMTIPEMLEVDVSDLGPGGAILASEVEYPDGVEPVFKVDFAIARILMPRQNVIGLEPEGEEGEEEEGEEVEGEEGEEGEEEEEGAPAAAEAPGA